MKVTRKSFLKRFGAFIGSATLFGTRKLSNNSRTGRRISEKRVCGWNILSDDIEGGLKTIQRSQEYGINHLQISHHVIHELCHVRDKHQLEVAKKFTKAAHDIGIKEVALWDHVLYDLDYYPQKFRMGPKNKLNLDNSHFWEWLKNDYREMLDIAPDVEAIILTFIETGAQVENQYSAQLNSEAEKLAALVNVIAEVIINEYKMNLYVRTFAYSDVQYERIVNAIDLFKHDDIRLMMKETPYDFFMTHPANSLPGRIDRPTIIEFDATGEFQGQGIVLNTFPDIFLKRWSDFLKRDHIIGYVARTDRFGSTHIIDRPTEIHLKAIQMYYEDQSIILDDIYEAFIKKRYSKRAYPMLRAAFENSENITLSIFYTLNTNTANHSRLNYDPYRSSYARNVSGRWLDPPVTYVPRNVNKEFHYWKDIINTITPDWAKKGGARLKEIPKVVDRAWLDKQENMNEEYYRYLLTEKDFGINLAKENLEHLESARPYLSQTDYEELYHLFCHTLLTIKLHRETAASYWGFRIYARGAYYRSDYVVDMLGQALDNMLVIADEIEKYPVKPPVGQWNWVKDIDMARTYHQWITKRGWPEKTHGYSVSFGGKTYLPD